MKEFEVEEEERKKEEEEKEKAHEAGLTLFLKAVALEGFLVIRQSDLLSCRFSQGEALAVSIVLGIWKR